MPHGKFPQNFGNFSFCQRLIPLSRIFKASIEDLRREASSLIAPTFHATDGPRRTYAVIVESRLSNQFDKRTVIDLIADIVGPKHKVDLERPDFVIMVQVFKGMCGISILPYYHEFKKYNLQEFYRAHQDQASQDS
jgi:tRNA acetyltransferase TAN1